MSKLVNYKKRSITLPPGCKDLADLLQPARPSKLHTLSAGCAHPGIRRQESGSVRLSGIGQHLRVLFQSHPYGAILTLRTSENRFAVNFTRMGPEMFAFAVVDENTSEERLLREFFTARGLELPSTKWTPATFVPGLPVQITFGVSPLPSDASAASELLKELFRDVCAFREDSEVAFHYYEMTNAT